MTTPANPPGRGLDCCLACRQVLSAVTTDPDWPGLCLHCARTGAGPMHVIRRTAPPPSSTSDPGRSS